MAKKIVKWQCEDGSVFDNEQDAIEYETVKKAIIDFVEDATHEHIDPLCPHDVADLIYYHRHTLKEILNRI